MLEFGAPRAANAGLGGEQTGPDDGTKRWSPRQLSGARRKVRRTSGTPGRTDGLGANFGGQRTPAVAGMGASGSDSPHEGRRATEMFGNPRYQQQPVPWSPGQGDENAEPGSPTNPTD